MRQRTLQLYPAGPDRSDAAWRAEWGRGSRVAGDGHELGGSRVAQRARVEVHTTASTTHRAGKKTWSAPLIVLMPPVSGPSAAAARGLVRERRAQDQLWPTTPPSPRTHPRHCPPGCFRTSRRPACRPPLKRAPCLARPRLPSPAPRTPCQSWHTLGMWPSGRACLRAGHHGGAECCVLRVCEASFWACLPGSAPAEGAADRSLLRLPAESEGSDMNSLAHWPTTKPEVSLTCSRVVPRFAGAVTEAKKFSESVLRGKGGGTLRGQRALHGCRPCCAAQTIPHANLSAL